MPKRKRREEDAYHVEVITKARVHTEGGSWEYRVKWAGYDEEDDWEPQQNLSASGCRRLLQSFWTHVGIDDDDYPPGHEVSASQDWIGSERDYFKNNFGEEIEKGKRQKKRDERRRQKEKEKKRRPKSTLPKVANSESSAPSSSKGEEEIQTIVLSDSSSDVTPVIQRKPSPVNIASTIIPPSIIQGSTSQIPHITIPPRKIVKVDDVRFKPTTPASAKNKGKQFEQGSSGTRKGRESPQGSPNSLFSDDLSPEISTAAFATTSTPDHTPKLAFKSTSLTKRKTAPLIKVHQLENLTSISALSTKQKLAQKALKIVTPNSPIPKQLSTKSHSAPEPSSVKDSEEILVSQPILVPDERSHQTDILPGSSSSADPPASCLSPVEYIPLADYDPDPFASFVPPPDPGVSPILHTPALPPAAAQDVAADADAFLNEIMFPESPAPMDDAAQIPRVAKPAALPRITKKWKWMGDLLIEFELDKAERLCEIMLTDATDYLAEGLRLNILFSEMKSIRFQKLYDVSLIDLVLRACKPSEQIARIAPNNEDDTGVLKGLANYMAINKQVTFTPIFTNDYNVATLLTFPPSMTDLCNRFDVPNDLQSSILVSVLIPLMITAKQKELEWRACNDASPKITHQFHAIVTDDHGKDVLRFDPKYCRALRTLDFPKLLHEFMLPPKSQSFRRPYCIWSSGGDGVTTAYGIETEWLISILDRCGAKNVGLRADVRVIFVHVGALATLPMLPAFAERRSKQPQIQFYTYGTHETVTPQRWGVREIFPIGGIVTFTPNAIIDDPIGVCQMIENIAEHPLWACYLLPAVVGMVSKMVYGNEDPLAVFDRGEYGYEELLWLIEQGKISLLQSPPLSRSFLRDNDLPFGWIAGQLTLMPMTARATLEECLKLWTELYSSTSESKWHTAIEADVVQDLKSMQMQPAIMDDYRRFVVIRSSKEARMGEYYGGFEWVTLSMFDFKDDYFKEQDGTK